MNQVSICMFKVLLLGWRPETIPGAQDKNLTRVAGASCKSKIFLFYTFSDAKIRWKRNARHYCFQNMYKIIQYEQKHPKANQHNFKQKSISNETESLGKVPSAFFQNIYVQVWPSRWRRCETIARTQFKPN